jgi:CMP/dCMP kinase
LIERDTTLPAVRKLRIAIDGPVSAGKSTAGQKLARRLGYRFLDTGQMYRAVTVAALDAGISTSDTPAVTALAHKCHIQVSNGKGITVDGRDITQRLRDPEVERNVSAVSAMPGVRVALVEKQRQIAAGGGIVMAGRDIGTVVLKDADIKFYLDASPETRARRRHEEMKLQGRKEPYEEVLASLKRRDRLDSTRTDSPLRPATDAEIINSDSLTLDQVVDRMEARVAALA